LGRKRAPSQPNWRAPENWKVPERQAFATFAFARRSRASRTLSVSSIPPRSVSAPFILVLTFVDSRPFTPCAPPAVVLLSMLARTSAPAALDASDGPRCSPLPAPVEKIARRTSKLAEQGRHATFIRTFCIQPARGDLNSECVQQERRCARSNLPIVLGKGSPLDYDPERQAKPDVQFDFTRANGRENLRTRRRGTHEGSGLHAQVSNPCFLQASPSFADRPPSSSRFFSTRLDLRCGSNRCLVQGCHDWTDAVPPHL
jgi:hypothetical protein